MSKHSVPRPSPTRTSGSVMTERSRLYRVIWHIDLEADSPHEAAEFAVAIMGKLDVDDACSATVFDVYERRAGTVQQTGRRIDLSNDSESRAIRLPVDTLP